MKIFRIAQRQDDDLLLKDMKSMYGLYYYTIVPRFVPEELDGVSRMSAKLGLEVEYADTGVGRMFRVPQKNGRKLSSGAGSQLIIPFNDGVGYTVTLTSWSNHGEGKVNPDLEWYRA